MIRKLSLPPISSSEDVYDPSCLLVLIRGLPPLSGAALASWLAPSSAFPLTRRDHPLQSPPSPQAANPSGLPSLSSRLHFLVGSRADACICAPLARGQKPTGSTQAGQHRRLRLSQPAVPLLRDYR